VRAGNVWAPNWSDMQMAVAADGGILLAAALPDPGGNATALGVTKYRADGTVDATFGTNGVARTPPGASKWLKDVAVAPDGSIVLAGFSNGVGLDAAVARFTPTGQLDTRFAGTGWQVLARPDDQLVYGAVVQPDGKIVLAGQSRGNQPGTYDNTLLIPGTANPAHLTENLAAGAVKLPESSLASLDKLSAPASAQEQP